VLVAVLTITIIAMSALLAVSAAANVKAVRALESADKRIDRLEREQSLVERDLARDGYAFRQPVGPWDDHAYADAIVHICRTIGYGRVMQVASDAWRAVDPHGAISLGPCYGSLEKEHNANR
jgi:hypothetical protein